MKCPKCSYTSFDYLDSCKKCGSDLRDPRTLLQIIAVSPEERASTTAPPSPAEEPEVGGMDYEQGDLPEDLAPAEDLGAEEHTAEDLFAANNFEESFDDLVERTSYEEGATPGQPGVSAAPEAETPIASPPPAEDEEDELLDLDFGDLFGDGEEDKA